MARILIADDEQPMRDMLALACRLERHEVFLAVDTPTTISAFATHKPDLLILDLSMPGGGGAEALNQLRAGFGGRMCPVIVVTGYLDSIPTQTRDAMGAFAWIEKPFTLDTLRAALRDALTPRRMQP